MSTRHTGHEACREVERRLREANRRLQAEGLALERDKMVKSLRAQSQADFVRAEEAIEALGVMRDELVMAGFPGGDRTVALANLRELIAQRKAARRRLEAAVNASCSCGGRGPDDGACAACMVWHRYEGRA